MSVVLPQLDIHLVYGFISPPADCYLWSFVCFLGAIITNNTVNSNHLLSSAGADAKGWGQRSANTHLEAEERVDRTHL